MSELSVNVLIFLSILWIASFLFLFMLIGDGEVESTLCNDCGIDTSDINEYCMLDDSLWDKIAPENTHNFNFFLCVGWLEGRAGRKLPKNDFPMNLPINYEGKHSDRLQNRLNSEN